VLPPLQEHLEAHAMLKDISDLSMPHEWYTTARAMKRKITLHVGPTNSGKTHHALLALQSAESGMYCAPLRLLALEVFEKLKGDVPTHLVTGDDRREDAVGANHVACTMEMADLDTIREVTVAIK